MKLPHRISRRWAGPAIGASLLLASPAPLWAGGLLECQDNALAAMNAAEVLERLRAAGGGDCRSHEAEWGETVSCESLREVRVFDLPVRELSSEIGDNGRRTLTVVTFASLARTRSAAETQSTAPGLKRVIEARDDGATTLRCVAEAGAYASGDIAVGITGAAPPLPAGATGWQVCAQPTRGPQRCAQSGRDGQYRITGLPPGEYGLLATPIGAADPLLRAVLTRRQIGQAAEGGPLMLADRINVRDGAMAQAGPLTLLRLPPGT